jgi:hypothetical protein
MDSVSLTNAPPQIQQIMEPYECKYQLDKEIRAESKITRWLDPKAKLDTLNKVTMAAQLVLDQSRCESHSQIAGLTSFQGPPGPPGLKWSACEVSIVRIQEVYGTAAKVFGTRTERM